MPTPQVKIPGISKILNEVKGAKRKNWSPLYGLAINGKIRFVIKRNGNQFKYSTVEVYEITKKVTGRLSCAPKSSEANAIRAALKFGLKYRYYRKEDLKPSSVTKTIAPAVLTAATKEKFNNETVVAKILKQKKLNPLPAKAGK